MENQTEVEKLANELSLETDDVQLSNKDGIEKAFYLQVATKVANYPSYSEREDMEERLKDCPFCGCTPKINLGKKYHCQLHGEPSQGIVIKCDWKDCPAKPSIEGGNIYNGIGDAIYKHEATQEAIKLWNTRKKV